MDGPASARRSPGASPRGCPDARRMTPSVHGESRWSGVVEPSSDHRNHPGRGVSTTKRAGNSTEHHMASHLPLARASGQCSPCSSRFQRRSSSCSRPKRSSPATGCPMMFRIRGCPNSQVATTLNGNGYFGNRSLGKTSRVLHDRARQTTFGPDPGRVGQRASSVLSVAQRTRRAVALFPPRRIRRSTERNRPSPCPTADPGMSRHRHHRGSGGDSEATARAVPGGAPLSRRSSVAGIMGASSDNEGTSPHVAATPFHTAGYVACPSTELVNDTELRRSTATGLPRDAGTRAT